MSDPAQLLVDHLDIWTGAIERKSSAGRGRKKNGGNGKISLYGIDKLRSLILDLAVRGKLVPQDLADGDAGELLKRVYRERKQLIADKKLSKPKAIRSEGSMLAALEAPRSWARDFFGNVFSLEYGDNLPERARSETGEFPVYGSNGVVGSHSEYCVNSPCIVVGRKGSAGAVNRCDVPACWVTDVAFYCVPPVGIDLRFVEILFVTLKLDDLGKGIKPGLNRNEANALPIALPPLAEQKRIVAKGDELMALVDALEAGTRAGMAAHETLVRELLATIVNSQHADDLAQNWSRIETHFDTLFTTEESIDALKQTIVDLGVRGKLCIQEQTEGKANQTKLRADRDAESFDLDAFEKRAELFGLPQGWTIEPLSRVSSNIVDCPHTTPKWTDEGEICVKSEQIFAGFLDLSRPNFVSEDTYIERIERLEPKADDILYKREGGILGIGARIPHGKRVCLGQRLMLIRANDAVLPAFLELVINSPWLRDFAREKTTGGAAPRVNMSIVRAYPVPIPPIQEQERILQRVDELFQLCERASKSIADSADVQTKLSDTVISSVA